ncbi:MAG TPA: response regulator transcription factor [Bacteroidia bacterium]|jgi:DNA-binding NarL/FixJ family response regulator
MTKSIKLAIIDDQALFRNGIVSLLRDYKEMEVVIEASNGMELLAQVETGKPDIILLDLEMPVMDGIKATELLKDKYPGIKILILTGHNDEAMVLHLIEKGAHGFLMKDTNIEIIIEAIHSIKENGYYFNDRVSKIMVGGLVKRKKINPFFNNAKLSDREIEVVRLISKEFKNSEIADKLFINIRTVDRHRENILRKINARNSIGLVMYAVKNNLLD